MARALLDSSLAALVSRLEQIRPETLPHEIKRDDLKIRKHVLYARTYLDVFAHSFALVDTDDEPFRDPWAELRDALDEGYERIGRFKDLYDAIAPLIGKDPETDSVALDDYLRAYRQAGGRAAERWLVEEIRKRRRAVLRWRDGFDLDGHRRAAAAALTDARIHETRRPRRQLSPLYWGALRAEPDARLGDLDNVRRLAFLLLADLRIGGQLANLRRIRNLVAEQDTMHMVRKRLRAVLTLAERPELESLITAAGRNSPCFQQLDDVVEACGDVNDLLARHALLGAIRKHADDPRARRDLEDRQRQLAVEIQATARATAVLDPQRLLERHIEDLAMLIARRIAPTPEQRSRGVIR